MAEFRTRSQRYATEVYELVQAVASATKKGDKKRDEYGSMAHKLPVLIRTAGLAQAVSFVAARGQEGAKELLTDLEKVLNPSGGEALQKKALDAPLPAYMALTQEALDALLWFKRFAQSVLDVDASTDTGDGEP